MSERRVAVVGTTSDYIEILRSRFPGRCLFITDPHERAKAVEPAPDAPSELLCDLTDADGALVALREHLRRWEIEPSGITSFDCESLALAAELGRTLGLPYPSADAVAACRSKFTSKQRWRRARLPCPEAELVGDADAAVGFLERTRRPAILKPTTGSGSELLFVCANADDCVRAFQTIRSRLASHWDVRMYGPSAREPVVIEELIQGTEFSCDFIVDGDRVEIIRIARKIHAKDHAVGTTLAYVLPAELPPPLDADGFRRQLLGAAQAVGLERWICMLDFMVEDGQAKMIEIAPRPGGDCLPPLLFQSCGLDMLGLALDFAERRPIEIPPLDRWRRLVGLRLFTKRPGVIRRFDDRAIRADGRVIECYLKRRPGHRVVLPPEDYDSRLLGHVIFEPSAPDRIEHECGELTRKLRLEMEPEE